MINDEFSFHLAHFFVVNVKGDNANDGDDDSDDYNDDDDDVVTLRISS